jgi:hypothetical protein
MSKKPTFIEHLKSTDNFEEDIVTKISYVLDLMVSRTDLPPKDANEIKTLLQRLSDDSQMHRLKIKKIIEELDRNDK